MRKNIIKNTLLIVFVYGTGQFLRLTGNLLVTRLLEPEMFGIVAVITVLLSGIIMFTDVGLNAAIIRSPKGTEPIFLNTTWSVQVIRGWIVFFIISALAGGLYTLNNLMPHMIQGVYKHHMLPIYMIVVAFSAILSGYAPMSPAIAIKNASLTRIQIIEVASQLVGIIFMLIFAWLYRSIWALVLTPIVSAVTKTFLLYSLHEHRHRFMFDDDVLQEINKYGIWILLSSALTFMSMQGDRLIFGYHLSPEQLGFYTIAFFLSNAIIDVIKRLSQNVFFPLFSKVKEQGISSLTDFYYKSRLRLDLLSGITAGFFAATGGILVDILYDPRYHEAGILFQILSLSILGHTISSLGLECLSASGNTKISAKIMLARSAIIFLALPLIFNFFGFYAAAFLVSVNVYITLPLLYHELHKHKLFSLSRELTSFSFPFIGYLLGSFLIRIINLFKS